MKILVVEDNEHQQNLAKTQLAEHDVTTTASYIEASRLMKATVFDALLTDMHLPATTGYPLFSKFKGQDAEAGWALVLLALDLNIPLIGCLSNGNHHNNLASSLMDLFEYKVMTIGSSKVLLDNENFIDLGASLEGDKLWNELMKALQN
ncbi:MAG: response regulator [Patescibacteria group bacterium]